MRNPSRQIKMKTVVWHDNKLTLKSHKKRGENIYLMLGCHKRVKLLNQEVHLFWCSHNEAIEIKREVGNLDSRWLDTIFLKNHPFSSYFLFAEIVYFCIALHIRYEVSIFLLNFNLENCNPIVTIFKFNLSLTTFATLLFDNRWRRFIFFFCNWMLNDNSKFISFPMTSMTLRKKGCYSAKNPNIVTIALQFSRLKFYGKIDTSYLICTVIQS